MFLQRYFSLSFDCRIFLFEHFPETCYTTSKIVSHESDILLEDHNSILFWVLSNSCLHIFFFFLFQLSPCVGDGNGCVLCAILCELVPGGWEGVGMGVGHFITMIWLCVTSATFYDGTVSRRYFCFNGVSIFIKGILNTIRDHLCCMMAHVIKGLMAVEKESCGSIFTSLYRKPMVVIHFSHMEALILQRYPYFSKPKSFQTLPKRSSFRKGSVSITGVI